ncbi:MAG: GAF domain-containing protein [Chloroflexi bacterium]|nr:GAF domain-containing protein [Chloroflexota bacterium]
MIARLRRRIRPTLLRWAMGIFCGLVGGLMLVAPHQLGGPTFAPIFGWVPHVGVISFLAGAALVAASTVGARGPLAVAAGAAVAGSLLILAVSFLITGGWTGVVVYSTFALATLLSAWCDPSSSPREDSIDLFVLTAAVAAALNGILLLTVSVGSFGAFYDPLRATVGWHGVAFLLGGVGVLATRLRVTRQRAARVAAQLGLGAAYLAWMLGSSLPNRIWTGILLYGGTGALLVLGPRLARHANRIDTTSLRVRLALAMASAAAFPLLFVATVATGWEERATAEQQLVLQQALASGLAADIGGAVNQHLVGLTLVAEHPVVLARSTAGRTDLLGDLGDIGEVAPGFASLGTFTASGQPLVMLGRPGARAADRLPVMARLALQRMPSGLAPPAVFLTPDDPPAIVLAVPIRQDGGALEGVAVGELDRRWLGARLLRGVSDARISTVVLDGAGRRIAVAGLPLPPDPAGRAGSPDADALAELGFGAGTLRFSRGSAEYLAGVARVAGTDWSVVVEQPVSSALAYVWFARELTFAVLVGAFLVSATVGVVLARRLAAPLAALARAAQGLATGIPTTIVPRSPVFEVRVLAQAFGDMQARLLARTAERERAESRFRILASASNELTRSLDEAAIVEALAQIVVAELADWCSVDMYDAERQLQHVVVLHADPARNALVSALQRQPPAASAEIQQAAATGAPLLMSVVTPRHLLELAPDPEQRRTLEWLGVRSMMVVPLSVRGQTIGTLGCVLGRGGRRFGTDDLALAQELALRAALAIENARLYAAEHEARAAAEAAVRARDEFLAVAAHELKTPVTSLRGFAELGVRAISNRGSLDPVMARRTLETIHRQSARLSALVANLLEVARGTTDRTALEPRFINLMDLVQIVIEAARVRAPERIIVCTGPDEAGLVADPLRLEQVFTNLLDNAVKYSPPSTQIEVSVTCVASTVTLVVRDHGAGVPPEDRERIFDRYFQAHGDPSMVDGQASGMGLGLYISREIVERHGGTIRAELPEDGGLRMVVTLPRDPDVSLGPGAPAGTPPG